MSSSQDTQLIRSIKRIFSETFKKLYAAQLGSAQDSLLSKKSSTLFSKAVDSAVDITDKALDIVKEYTLKHMDVSGYDELNETDQNDLESMVIY